MLDPIKLNKKSMAKPKKGVYDLEQYDFYYDSGKNVAEVGEFVRIKRTGVRMLSIHADELNKHFANTGLKYVLQETKQDKEDETPTEKDLLVALYLELAEVDTVNKNWGIPKLTSEIKLLES